MVVLTATGSPRHRIRRPSARPEPPKYTEKTHPDPSKQDRYIPLQYQRDLPPCSAGARETSTPSHVGRRRGPVSGGVYGRAGEAPCEVYQCAQRGLDAEDAGGLAVDGCL
jgi:hypothetical protein